MTGFERYRRKALLSQTQLAKTLGVTPAAISAWENAKGTPRLSLVQKMADMYGVTMEELLRTDYPEVDILEDKAKGA